MTDKRSERNEFTRFEHSLSSVDEVRPTRNAKNFAKVLAIIFTVWIFILALAPWQQTSLGRGRVIAYSPTEREQAVDAPVDGRLGQWFVYEGSHVNAGDPIVEMSDNDPEIIQRLKAEREALVSKLAAATLSSRTAKINLGRQRHLEKEGLSSRRSYELANLEYAKYLTDEANANAELVRIDTRLARQKTQFIHAPRSGFILRRTAGESSVLVKTGDTLALLVPDTASRAVELWIGGNDISLIRLGQKVRIQFEGWPAVQFSGWPTASVGTYSGNVAVIDATDNGEGKFRVLVLPESLGSWPDGSYLRQGVRAQGWVLLGNVTLGYELWRKMNGFPPSWIKTEEGGRQVKK